MTAVSPLNRSAPGVRMGDMRSVQDAAASMVDRDSQYGLTALASGAQADSPVLLPGFNLVATVAGAADSVQLPPANVGTMVLVTNGGGAAMQVFGNEDRTDTINGTAGATGVSHGNGLTALYYCPEDTKWFRLLSA